MSKPRPIQFRAIHDKNRWRHSSHQTEKHAFVGSSSTDTRSARALFEHRNNAINYNQEGEPRFVVVWDPKADVGTIVRPDSSKSDGLLRASITMEDIERFEQEGPPSDAELERYFVPDAVSISRADFHDLDGVNEDFNQRLAVSLQSSAADRKRRLARADPVPPRVEVRTSVFVRNTDVIVEVLERAAGVCEGCQKPAPFVRASNGTPYLEVHHRVHLAHGGPDTVANALALCPNCHRQQHFGKWVGY
ncbi:HNH endonuclease signature motif containing protein [Comamonas sp. F1-6]|uniref:HNH endonuclease n=1 Tax=Comamonas sp. F1-6 TaxID=673550 RepID=UPI0031E4811B